MNTYNVRLPVAGYVDFEINAESEEEAKEQALSEPWGIGDVVGLNIYEKLVEGNVCHVDCWEAEIDCIEEDVQEDE
jgi:hypothetical protein